MGEHRTEPGRPRVGLVLGAGGVRGCAHAGVYQVLRSAGIPVDVVVGASAGSIFGLGIAADLPAEYIARVGREASPLQMFRFYVGRLRTDRKNPIANMLREAGEGRTFADLPKPFAVRATEMETGTPRMIDRGPVLPAVEASIALPFIARPVAIDGIYYVDGGLFDTAPVGDARRMGADIVIAICLGFNYLAPGFLRRRPWTQPLVERLGRQRGCIRGHLVDQLRFGFRLCAASYTSVPVGEEADIAIWPEFNGLSPNSMTGGAFCFGQGVLAAREAVRRIEEVLLNWRASPRPGAVRSGFSHIDAAGE
jgi:predicted acylesterase/phospholipase RssA